VDVFPDIVHGKVEPNIPVKLSIQFFTGIAAAIGPNQAGCLIVTGESCDPVGAIHRPVIATVYLIGRQEHTLARYLEPGDPMIPQGLFKPRVIATLWQPETFGHMTKIGQEGLNPQFYLGIDRGRIIFIEGQIGMGSRSGNQFKMPAGLKGPKTIKNIAMVVIVEIKQVPIGLVQIVLGHFQKFRLFILTTDYFFLPESFVELKVGIVSVLQAGVGKHATECRRQADCKLEGDFLALQFIEHSQQREVTFRNRFKKPVFLKETGIFKMPHIGKMGIENKSYGIVGH
jgi:hypothetical protein